LKICKILSNQNNVEYLKLENSGHMVLLDNGEKILKERILSYILRFKSEQKK